MHELLKLLLDRFKTYDSYYFAGLCKAVSDISYLKQKERNRLLLYISQNRPSKYSSPWAYSMRYSYYYWPAGWMFPRRAWLKKHIKRCKKLGI